MSDKQSLIVLLGITSMSDKQSHIVLLGITSMSDKQSLIVLLGITSMPDKQSHYCLTWYNKYVGQAVTLLSYLVQDERVKQDQMRW